MQIIKLYKYQRENGGVTVSPNKPDCDYTEMFRLIAEGTGITNDGVNITTCADVENIDGWHEVENTDEEATAEDYKAALAELGVIE